MTPREFVKHVPRVVGEAAYEERRSERFGAVELARSTIVNWIRREEPGNCARRREER